MRWGFPSFCKLNFIFRPNGKWSFMEICNMCGTQSKWYSILILVPLKDLPRLINKLLSVFRLLRLWLSVVSGKYFSDIGSVCPKINWRTCEIWACRDTGETKMETLWVGLIGLRKIAWVEISKKFIWVGQRAILLDKLLKVIKRVQLHFVISDGKQLLKLPRKCKFEDNYKIF